MTTSKSHFEQLVALTFKCLIIKILQSEKISDIDQYLFIEKGLRGGIF